jgi:hypothetical protein
MLDVTVLRTLVRIPHSRRDTTNTTTTITAIAGPAS